MTDELKEGAKKAADPKEALQKKRPLPGRAPRPGAPGPGPAAPGTPSAPAAAAGAPPAEAGLPTPPVAPGLPPPDVAELEAKSEFKSLPPPDKNMPRKQLVEQYMPYVRSIAGKVKKTLSKDIEFDDLVSYGMTGLLEAADRFDAKYGANFMTFAYYRIRGAIYDGLRGMGWVSRTEYQRYRFEQHANSYLNSLNESQSATPSNIKKTDDEEVGELANVVEGLVTIYVTALDAMEGFQIKDDRGPGIEESLENLQARELVADAVSKLPEQERKLLELYYYKEMSLEDVGKELGLSKSWTSRLHTRAITKLSRLLKELVAEYQESEGGAANRPPGARSTQPQGSPTR